MINDFNNGVKAGRTESVAGRTKRGGRTTSRKNMFAADPCRHPEGDNSITWISYYYTATFQIRPTRREAHNQLIQTDQAADHDLFESAGKNAVIVLNLTAESTDGQLLV